MTDKKTKERRIQELEALVERQRAQLKLTLECVLVTPGMIERFERDGIPIGSEHV